MKKVRSIFENAVYDVSTQEVVPLGGLHPVAKFDFISYLDELINYNAEKSRECELIVNDYNFVIKFKLRSYENSIMFINVIHPKYIDVAKYLLSQVFTVKVNDNRI
ncbi:MAG: hypothetical protein QXX12_01400 [Nanopusillaceae archaeon]